MNRASRLGEVSAAALSVDRAAWSARRGGGGARGRAGEPSATWRRADRGRRGAMASSPLGGLQGPARCSCCRRAFDHAERAPQLLACKHHVCLACARSGGVCCEHCWKRTERLPADAAVLALARRLAAPPAPPPQADVLRLAARRRDFTLRALDAAAALTARLEAELAAPADGERLRLQCRLDDLVRAADAPLDSEAVRRALAAPHAGGGAVAVAGDGPRDPELFLANYCAAQVHARRLAEGALPRFYLELSVGGRAWGRVVVQTRPDVAPRMARTFGALATGEAGVSYRGCCVFQCWADESVIAGAVEAGGGGTGGGGAREAPAFAPDESRLAAVRGAVGMRRSQRRRDSLGLVASQFRIVLREMRGFTAIFGSVVHGLELVDRLSRTGDGAGKPHATIVISACGRLD